MFDTGIAVPIDSECLLFECIFNVAHFQFIFPAMKTDFILNLTLRTWFNVLASFYLHALMHQFHFSLNLHIF